MGEGTATKPEMRRRRIIERPRLTRLLDGSQGRIKMLVAPAGYGKTTLARQWLEGKQAVWYTATPASVDLAALAASLTERISLVVPSAGDALLAGLPALGDSADPALLAGMLASDLERWPDGVWLAIDDYHVFAGTSGEAFVEALLLQVPLKVLLMARQRPRWSSARRILYGEVSEIDRAALAMTDSEAMDLLADDVPDAPELVNLARGWPAVLALASLSSAPIPDITAVPYLYGFFADEIYQRIDHDVRGVLCELAVLDEGGRKLALQELRKETAELVVKIGLDSGFLTEGGQGVLEMHPLLRSFLERKMTLERGADADRIVGRFAPLLIAEKLWDEAYRLVVRSKDTTLLSELIAASMDDMLALGRIATLKSWIESADEDAAPVRLLRAELAFREGRFYESESLATLSAADHSLGDAFRARSLLVAGRAAHAASRPSRAAELYSDARVTAPSEQLRRSAALGELSAAIELERPDALNLLRALGPTDALRPDDRVVLVSRMINLETRFGLPVSIDEGRAMRQLLAHVADPVSRSSFRNVFGYALAAMGYFDEALELTDEQIEDADGHRLDFVIPYALTNRAIASIGRHDYVDAQALLDEAEERSLKAGDQTAYHIAWCVRTRMLNAQAAFDMVLARPLPKEGRLTRSLEGELLAGYAIACAGLGDVDRARDYADRAESNSIALEIAISAPCARAISYLKTRASEDALINARSALSAATRSGMIESFVCAYRGCPELVVCLLQDRSTHDDLTRVLTTALDAATIDPRERASHSVLNLSKREKEVLALVAQGLSNIEIGMRLFISPVTVKVHVRHIFDKLGVRSRAEAALRASQISRD